MHQILLYTLSHLLGSINLIKFICPCISGLKQFPKSIAKRISDTSSSKDTFDKSISIYQNALGESGLKDELRYTSSDTSFREENN